MTLRRLALRVTLWSLFATGLFWSLVLRLLLGAARLPDFVYARF